MKLFFTAFVMIFISACVYEDYDKPTPTELFDSSRKVLFIGVDGMRYDIVNETTMPFLWSFLHEPQSAYTLDGLNETMTLSAPNWSSLLTGVHWNKHKVLENDFIGEQLEQWPSVFHRLESTYINFETASVVHWEPINQIIIRNCVDTEVVADDDGVRDLGSSILEYNEQLDLMFMHFDDMDHMGHSYGFGPDYPEYVEAAGSIDAKIQDVIETLRSRTYFESENWLVIVATDHGGEGNSHGNTPFVPTSPNIRRIPMIFNANSIVPGELGGHPNSVDVAVTILKYFGLSYSELDGVSIPMN